MTIEDALTQALLNGHVMTTFAVDPILTWPTSTCRACGLRLFRYPDGAIAGPVLLLPCALGRAIVPPRGRLEPG
jgi:uncharacterized Zn finger protein (UPF0148 family)